MSVNGIRSSSRRQVRTPRRRCPRDRAGPELSSGASESSSSPAMPARWNWRAARRRLAIWYVITTVRISRPCRMMMNSRGTWLEICSATSPRDRIAPQDRGEDDADRVVLAEERDGDPREPETDDVVQGQVAAVGQDQLHPDQAGQRPRDQEQAQLRRADRHPAGLGRSRRRADRPGLVAQTRPPDQEPDDDRGRDREEQQPRQVRPRRDAEHRARGRRPGPSSGKTLVRRSTNAPSGASL